MIRILLAPSLTIARTVRADVTVEAEYGDVVVEGKLFTAAHHQKNGKYSRANSPAPCNNPDIPIIKEGIILISHLDLDTIGGCLRASLQTSERDLFMPDIQGFWDLAEFVDLNGIHKIGEAGADAHTLREYNAYLAANKELPWFAPDKLSDATAAIDDAREKLTSILIDGDEDALARGDAFVRNQDDLNARTFLAFDSGAQVISRIAESKTDSCNHLYTGPQGQKGRAIVTLNKENARITISFADPIPGLSCRTIVQDIFGPEAGGHDGIAGSPRGEAMTIEHFNHVHRTVCQLIQWAE